jgi:hypothetical protein
MEGTATRDRARVHDRACLNPQLLSRKRARTDGFHLPLHSVAEHRTRFVCLGAPPSPRVRCLSACLLYYLLTYSLLGRF